MSESEIANQGIVFAKDFMLPAAFTALGGIIGFVGSYLVFRWTRREQIRDQLIQEFQKLDAAIYACSAAQEEWFYGRQARSEESFDKIEDSFIRNARQVGYSMMFLKVHFGSILDAFEKNLASYMAPLQVAMQDRLTHTPQAHEVLIKHKNELFERLQPTFMNVICRYGTI